MANKTTTSPVTTTKIYEVFISYYSFPPTSAGLFKIADDKATHKLFIEAVNNEDARGKFSMLVERKTTDLKIEFSGRQGEMQLAYKRLYSWQPGQPILYRHYELLKDYLAHSGKSETSQQGKEYQKNKSVKKFAGTKKTA